MLDKIDLGNSRTLTILIIVCILIFACIYVILNKQNNLEGFAESVLETGDTVRLKDGLKSVILGSGTSAGNASDYINALIPAMTIVAYNGDAAPTGWQICDGKPLNYTNGDSVLAADGNSFINTPNLKGRAIIGANPTVDTTNGISVRNKGEIGGAETHKLLPNEMPQHDHKISSSSIGCTGSGCNVAANGSGDIISSNYGSYIYTNPGGLEGQTITKAGNDEPHNNMQPYYVLNYIIKQPSK